MAISENYLNYITDQLSAFGTFEIKKMFGGVGIFRDGLMFGMIGSDIFRLKVDEENRQDFEEKGMQPFYSEKMKKGMPYWEVPVNVLEDRSELAKWAQKSFKAALRSKSKKK